MDASKYDALDDFEKQLAAEKAEREKEESKSRSKHHRSSRHRSRSRSRDRHGERKHRSSRHDDDDCRERDKDRDRHRHKRRHRSDSPDQDDDRRSRHRRDRSRDRARERSRDKNRDGERHRRHEKTSDPKKYLPIPDEESTDKDAIKAPAVARDSWMTEPSAMDFDYTQRGARKEEPKIGGGANEVLELKMHKNELNRHLADARAEHPVQQAVEKAEEESDHEVDYEFGDSGAQWRMTKLKAVYREAEEQKGSVEEVAVERLGSLREFDNAREEETELERRRLYGKGYVGKVKPSGELYEERKQKMEIHRQRQQSHDDKMKVDELPQGQVIPDETAQPAAPVDQSKLNQMRAALLKAQLRKAPNAPQLEREYNEARAAFDAVHSAPSIVVLGEMEARLLAGTRGEVIPLTNKRGIERGLVKENEDMSIEDMVREERRTRNVAGGEGRKLAERIAKDGKFENDLDYIDDNVEKLAKNVPKSMMNLKNMAVSEFQKMERVLENCQLCHHEEKNQAPIAPILALGTRVYLTLPTNPEVGDGGGAVIVPIQHRTNLLECDDDEWEEIRNFQKSLTRMYHDQGRSVVFYENAAFPQRRGHAAMHAVPIAYEQGELAPAFFKEAILANDVMENSQHRKLYDTAKMAREMGDKKGVFRRTFAKEVPYWHVWFDVNGGLGHVVDEENWPKGDLFAREVIAGICDQGSEVWRRQGRWQRGADPRIEEFTRRFRKFDWTRVLTDGM